MPIPRWVARLNRRFTNRLMAPIARVAPGFGFLLHRGRTTGRTYRIPINVFTCGDRFVFALTYGEEADWVRNVLAAHGALLERRGRRTVLAHPRIVEADAVAGCVPGPIVRVLAAVDVHRFLVMDLAGEDAA